VVTLRGERSGGFLPNRMAEELAGVVLDFVRR
jgi:hypothetical protein